MAPPLSEDEIQELCGFDLGMVEYHKSLFTTEFREQLVTRAATRLQAIWRGKQWRTSDALALLLTKARAELPADRAAAPEPLPEATERPKPTRGNGAGGGGRAKPNRSDPQFQAALRIPPAELLHIAYQTIGTDNNVVVSTRAPRNRSMLCSRQSQSL